MAGMGLARPICLMSIKTKTQTQEFLHSKFPKTVKTLSMFEDFDENLAATVRANRFSRGTPEHANMAIYRRGSYRVTEALVSRSVDPEELSISYMVDAADFFGTYTPALTWQNLRSLALTSQLLHAQNGQSIQWLLYYPGAAALRIPSLRRLVIWRGFKGSASAIIYQVDEEHASITWRSTWDLDLTPGMIKVRQRVALQLHDLKLQIFKRLIYEEIVSHGDAIHHLNLPCNVVDPISLRQMRKEVDPEDQSTRRPPVLFPFI
ncbi:hypothetical protein EDB81DRAFT_879672 [Dactylonectria macrodidyma]|uniref:DUF6546 domain-containing protein n=1 Tax=Dactylonectria macrodidyma TaxID=307937 RepID=A0A9P9FEG1_9HYPO|nr:hypothetical protein EDB81DRAFT_879672 [Dactylonectria macrodidyma]